MVNAQQMRGLVAAGISACATQMCCEGIRLRQGQDQSPKYNVDQRAKGFAQSFPQLPDKYERNDAEEKDEFQGLKGEFDGKTETLEEKKDAKKQFESQLREIAETDGPQDATQPVFFYCNTLEEDDDEHEEGDDDEELTETQIIVFGNLKSKDEENWVIENQRQMHVKQGDQEKYELVEISAGEKYIQCPNGETLGLFSNDAIRTDDEGKIEIPKQYLRMGLHKNQNYDSVQSILKDEVVGNLDYMQIEIRDCSFMDEVFCQGFDDSDEEEEEDKYFSMLIKVQEETQGKPLYARVEYEGLSDDGKEIKFQKVEIFEVDNAVLNADAVDQPQPFVKKYPQGGLDQAPQQSVQYAGRDTKIHGACDIPVGSAQGKWTLELSKLTIISRENAEYQKMLLPDGDNIATLQEQMSEFEADGRNQINAVGFYGDYKQYVQKEGLDKATQAVTEAENELADAKSNYYKQVFAHFEEEKKQDDEYFKKYLEQEGKTTTQRQKQHDTLELLTQNFTEFSTAVDQMIAELDKVIQKCAHVEGDSEEVKADKELKRNVCNFKKDDLTKFKTKQLQAVDGNFKQQLDGLKSKADADLKAVRKILDELKQADASFDIKDFIKYYNKKDEAKPKSESDPLKASVAKILEKALELIGDDDQKKTIIKAYMDTITPPQEVYAKFQYYLKAQQSNLKKLAKEFSKFFKDFVKGKTLDKNDAATKQQAKKAIEELKKIGNKFDAVQDLKSALTAALTQLETDFPEDDDDGNNRGSDEEEDDDDDDTNDKIDKLLKNEHSKYKNLVASDARQKLKKFQKQNKEKTLCDKVKKQQLDAVKEIITTLKAKNSRTTEEDQLLEELKQIKIEIEQQQVKLSKEEVGELGDEIDQVLSKVPTKLGNQLKKLKQKSEQKTLTKEERAQQVKSLSSQISALESKSSLSTEEQKLLQQLKQIKAKIERLSVKPKKPTKKPNTPNKEKKKLTWLWITLACVGGIGLIVLVICVSQSQGKDASSKKRSYERQDMHEESHYSQV